MTPKPDIVRQLYACGCSIDEIARQVELAASSCAAVIISDLMRAPPERLSLFEQNLLHLVDLKRKGHSPKMTELRDPPERWVEAGCWPPLSYLP